MPDNSTVDLTSDSSDRHSFFESIDELPQPKPFPDVAQRIIAACESPDVEARDLSGILQCDPSMTVRVLQVANSSMYGFSGEICSIDHAIVALGIRAIKDLAVSLAANGVFVGEGDQIEIRRELWMHSLACGAVAAQLAPHLGLTASEAFLAGIVHDVGKLVLIEAAKDHYVATTSKLNSCEIVDVENRIYGLNHQEVGARCADEWGLPCEINAAIEFHHAPETADDFADLAGVVCLANTLTKKWDLGGMLGVDEDVEGAMARTEVSIDEETLVEIRAAASDQLAALTKVCS